MDSDKDLFQVKVLRWIGSLRFALRKRFDNLLMEAFSKSSDAIEGLITSSVNRPVNDYNFAI